MDKEKIERAIRDIIEAVGDDPEREGLLDTPRRVARMLEDILSGIREDPAKAIKVYEVKNQDEMIIVRDIPFFSVCEHHLLPFFGRVHIAYIPKDDRITGFSNLVRIVEIFSKRLQIQERFTTQIADTIMQVLKPMGVLVVVEARQLCMEMQGVRKQGTYFTTSAMRGAFRREVTRLEALSLIGKEKGG